MSERSFKQICDELSLSVQNATVEAAAQIALAYGAPAEACLAILRLKTSIESPLSRKEPSDVQS